MSSKERLSFKYKKLQEPKSRDQLDHLGRGSLSRYLWLKKNVLTGYWKDMEGLLIMNIEKGSEIEEGVKKRSSSISVERIRALSSVT